jgi:hypothetical protein
VEKESVFLKEIQALLSDEEVTLGEIAEKLKSKGLVFLSLVCLLPFMQPIPIPGLSTLLGFVIALQGLGLILFGKPLMTKKMAQAKLSPSHVRSFVSGAEKIYPWIRWMINRRGAHIIHQRWLEMLAGIFILFLAAFLSLPLPLPGSNFLPAIGIFFICLGLLEDDLLLVILGFFYALMFSWLISLSMNLILREIDQWSWLRLPFL